MQPRQDTEIADVIERVEAAEDRTEHDIDKAEPIAGEPGSRPKFRFQTHELRAEH